MHHTVTFVPLADAPPAHLAQVLSSAEMLRYMDLPRWEHTGDVAALLHACRSGQSSLHILLRNGSVAGIAGLSHICHKHQFAYITCGILPAYQRSGLAREALKRIDALAFRGLALHRIEAQVHEHNASCINLLHSLGYTQEGRMRGNFLVDGVFYDSVLLSKISEEAGLLASNFSQ